MAIIDGLAVYYSLEESSGAAVDAHGSLDLPLTGGAIASATGKVGNCRDIEAGDLNFFQEVDATIGAAISLAAGGTVACWVNAETLVNFPALAHKGWGDGSGNANQEWIVYYDTSASRWKFDVRGGSTTTEVTASTFGAMATAEWHLLIVDHDPDADVIGIQIDNGTRDTTAHSAGVNDGDRVFQLGGSSGQGLCWDGLIDEFAIWTRVLTSNDRTFLWNSGNGRSYSDLVAAGGNLTVIPVLIGGKLLLVAP